MFSMLNSKWASIRALSLSRVGSMRCLMSRFVSLCLGGFTDELDAPSSTVDPNSKTIADAQASAVWKAYIDAGVAAANKEAISGAQQTKKWAILSADFSVPGGELTPTLKLKRPVVYEKYAAEIDAIYAGDAPKASKKKGKKKK